MTKNEIINVIAKERLVERIVSNISKGSFNNTEDLSSDVYLDLLSKDESKLQHLYDTGALPFFIVRIVTNNLYSTSSRYYKQYAKWDSSKSPLKDEYTE